MNITYNFKVDGFYNSTNYFRSETPMNSNAMPAALATGIASLSHVDSTAVEGKKYYVRFSSVKNDAEKISSEISVYAKNFTPYSAFFWLENLTDKKGGVNLTKTGTVTYSDDGAYFDGNGSWLSKPNIAAIQFGTGDLTLELEFKMFRTVAQTYQQAFVECFYSGVGGWWLGISGVGKVYLYFNTPNVNAITSTNTYIDGLWHKVKWTRQGSLNSLYVDDILVGTYSDQRNLTIGYPVNIGAQVNARQANYDFKGWIRKVGFAKQVL